MVEACRKFVIFLKTYSVYTLYIFFPFGDGLINEGGLIFLLLGVHIFRYAPAVVPTNI